MPRIEQIRNLLQREPDDVFLNFSLAMEHQEAGDVEEALRIFNRVIELDPNYLAAYVQAAQMLTANKRKDQALAIFEQGLSVAHATNDTHMVDKIQQMIAAMS